MTINVLKGVECPCCGYDILMCNWVGEELKEVGSANIYCDMCESYCNIDDKGVIYTLD